MSLFNEGEYYRAITDRDQIPVLLPSPEVVGERIKMPVVKIR